MDSARLKEVKTLITHLNCHDGVASALVVKDVLPNVEIVWLTPGSPEHRNLKPVENSLWCDISPPMESVDGWLEAKAIVLDHHAKQAPVVEKFGADGIIQSEDGVCGATLAYQHVWLPLASEGKKAEQRQYDVRQYVSLVGVRDTNLTKDKRWNDSGCLQQALTFFPFEELLRGFPSVYEEMKFGKFLVEKQTQKVKDALERSYKFQYDGLKVIVFNGTSLSSEVSNLLGDQYDVVIGCSSLPYGEHEVMHRYSVRSATGFDCYSFCSKFGGGGHFAASGLGIKESIVSTNAYCRIENLFRIYRDSLK